MVYTRGSAEDYDRWAAVTGDSGWSWDNLLPYFFKVRKNSSSLLTKLTDRRTKNGRRPRTTMTRVVNSIRLCTVHTESTLSVSVVLGGPFSRIRSFKPPASSLKNSPSIWITTPGNRWASVGFRIFTLFLLN